MRYSDCWEVEVEVVEEEEEKEEEEEEGIHHRAQLCEWPHTCPPQRWA
jgi:hypothetical protein